LWIAASINDVPGIFFVFLYACVSKLVNMITIQIAGLLFSLSALLFHCAQLTPGKDPFKAGVARI
jgi:hypothetical protein